MLSDIKVEERLAQPILSVRTRTSVDKLPQILGETYGAIAQYLGELGECPIGPPFAGYFNMDMQDLDVEIGFPVTRVFDSRDQLKAGQIPPGKAATATYTGPYEQMEPAYNELFLWINDNGYEVSGVVYEFYLNDPATTPPEQLQTQIVFMLQD